MPDIAMCRNYECPIRNNCYRYRAVPSPYWQSYVAFEFDEGVDECEYFMETEENDRLIPLRVCDSVSGRFMERLTQ